jgi:hypothetical protein
VKKGQNGRKSLRRLKPAVGCNVSKRRRRRMEIFLIYIKDFLMYKAFSVFYAITV